MCNRKVSEQICSANRSNKNLKMIFCNNYLFLFFVTFIKIVTLTLSPSSYYHYKIDHFNPYSRINNNDTFVLRPKLKKPLLQQSEEQILPQWRTIQQDTPNFTSPNNNIFRRRVMVGYGKKPLNESLLLATGTTNLMLYNNISLPEQNQFGRRQALVVRFLFLTFFIKLMFISSGTDKPRKYWFSATTTTILPMWFHYTRLSIHYWITKLPSWISKQSNLYLLHCKESIRYLSGIKF